jgi:flavodoxin
VFTSSLTVPWQLSCALKFIISDSKSDKLSGKSVNFVCNSWTSLFGKIISSDERVLFNNLASFWAARRVAVSLASKRFFEVIVCSYR